MKNKKINIAELLKGCPKGMELDCAIYDNVTLLEVADCDLYPIRIKTKSGYISELTKFGQNVHNDDAKCVIFPKGKTTWEGFQRPFMDGDIVVCTNGSCTFTAIFKGMRNGSSFYRYGVMYDNEFRCLVNDWSDFNDSCRLATEEEKAKLFDAIKDNGYKWHEETKTLEKLPKFKVGDKIVKKGGIRVPVLITGVGDTYYWSNTENSVGVLPIAEQDDWELVPDKFDITTLKPFESKVLVRYNKDNKWCGSFFSHIDGNLHSHCYKYVTVAGKSYPMCIPYEGNEHLLGTTNECDEYFKTW